jgi:hypothetical protein
MESWRAFAHLPLVFTICLSTVCSPERTQAQALNWEGQTGALMTPFAYVTASPVGRVGRPTLAFHVLDGGDVIGIHYQMSVTVGLLNRMEVGVTRSAVSSVGDEPIASLFDRGFTTLHAKVVLVSEAGGFPGPTVAVGALVRWQKEHIAADIIPSDPTQDADVFLVATKTITATDGVSFVVSGGVRGTNASFMGIAGNAPSWEARGFASGGVLLGRSVMLGAEVRQQPAHLDGFPEARIPSTVAYFARVQPRRTTRFNFDLALVDAGGSVAAGQDLKAQSRLAGGVSFRF